MTARIPEAGRSNDDRDPAFNDTINPMGRLKPPGNYDELVTDSVTDALPGIVGWINEGVRWASREIFGHEINPVKWLTEAVGGDWGDLLSLADVWNNLAWANNDIGTNLVRGLTELNPYWNGNAAQAFDAHMEKWWGAFEENEALCANVRDTLKDLAKVAKEFLQAAIDLIEMLVSVLGGGGPVALIFRAFDIGQGAINSWRVYNALTKTIQAAVSIFEMIAADRPDTAPNTKVEIPSTPYGGPSAPGTM